MFSWPRSKSPAMPPIPGSGRSFATPETRWRCWPRHCPGCGRFPNVAPEGVEKVAAKKSAAKKVAAKKAAAAKKVPAARTRPRRVMAVKSESLLGEGFAIGVATAGYQVEGGYNGDGEPENNWANWERTGRVERSGIACDFWAHPEEALDRAAAIGCNAFRLSVEWTRLEPVQGDFDQ